LEEIDIKAYQARTPSDHFPVKVELVFEGEEQK
jgi:endonuclease/exonuclease/phosphatase family metal-dependent hydrolase